MTKNLVLHCVHRLSRMGLSRGGHRNQHRTAASKSLHHGTPYSGTRNWPETRPLRELVIIIICTPTIHCRGNRKPFQNKIINPTSPFYTNNNTQSVLSRSHSKRTTDSYNLSLYPHSNTPKRVRRGLPNLAYIKNNILVLLRLNMICLETGSFVYAKLMREDLFV